MKSSTIEPGFLTDHSKVHLEVGVKEFVWDTGVWRFNNKLLLDRQFCMHVNDLIEVLNNAADLLSPNDKWEFIKMEVSAYCKKYAKKKASKKRDRIKALLRQKQLIETNTKINDDLRKQELGKIENELTSAAIEKVESSIFRSQCRFAKDGEKCSSFFLSLEKKRYLEKNMKCVITDTGVTSRKQNVIMDEQTKFYKNLYNRNASIAFTL